MLEHRWTPALSCLTPLNCGYVVFAGPTGRIRSRPAGKAEVSDGKTG
jgi:hypothetical protein